MSNTYSRKREQRDCVALLGGNSRSHIVKRSIEGVNKAFAAKQLRYNSLAIHTQALAGWLAVEGLAKTLSSDRAGWLFIADSLRMRLYSLFCRRRDAAVKPFVTNVDLLTYLHAWLSNFQFAVQWYNRDYLSSGDVDIEGIDPLLAEAVNRLCKSQSFQVNSKLAALAQQANVCDIIDTSVIDRLCEYHWENSDDGPYADSPYYALPVEIYTLCSLQAVHFDSDYISTTELFRMDDYSAIKRPTAIQDIFLSQCVDNLLRRGDTDLKDLLMITDALPASV